MNLERHYKELLGLDKNWRVERVELVLERQRVEIIVGWSGSEKGSCPECGKSCRIYDLREERSWRHLDTMQFETIIRCRVPRVKCAQHGVLTMATPWAGKHSRFTLLFEAFAVLVLQASQTVEAARRLLGLSWRQVDEIRTRAVERGLERRRSEPIDYLGIDEKSFARGHSYVSVLADLQAGRVLEVAPGRDEGAAQELLETLSAQQRSEALAVAVDMWPAYMKQVKAQMGEAVLVHDRFHVVKHLNDAVDKVRRRENKLLMARRDERLKGSRYLWLKGLERMSPQARSRFHELKDSGLKVGRAWTIKHLFEEFWTFDFGSDARAFFRDWYGWAIRSRLDPIKQVARMLKAHLHGLLGYILHPITNATTEGLNSKIQLLKASARGFRSFAKYRIAILFHCGKLDLLPSTSPQKS